MSEILDFDAARMNKQWHDQDQESVVAIATVSLLRNKQTRVSQLFQQERLGRYNPLFEDDDFYLRNYLLEQHPKSDPREMQYLYDLAVNCLTNKEQPLSWVATRHILDKCGVHAAAISPVIHQPLTRSRAEVAYEAYGMSMD